MVKYILLIALGYFLALAQVRFVADYTGSATVFDKVLIDAEEF